MSISDNVKPQGGFVLNSSQWKSFATWALTPSGFLYKFISVKLGLPVPDAGSVAELLLQFGPLAVGGIITLARRTQDRIVAEAARILAARDQHTAAAVVEEARAQSAIVRSSAWVLSFVALLLLGACAPQPDDTPTTKAQRLVDSITLAYLPIKTAAQLCAAGTLCSDQAVRDAIARALPVADDAVAEAKMQILANVQDQSATSRYSSLAMSAIKVLAEALTSFGVKAG